MKNILLFALLISHAIINCVLAQCSSRPYASPEEVGAWDWRGDGDYIFVNGIQNNQPVFTLTKSPWFVNETSNLNTNPFKLQFPKDYEPANGWVLVQRDFGKTSPLMAVDYPYFVLYNKFSGILRIFVAITQNISGYNAAVITLTYVNGQGQIGPLVRTAILENHTINPFRSALDDFDNQVPVITVPNYYSNTTINPYWLHADFVMNYDPCTCKNLSQLIFEAKLVSNANLSFELNGSIVQGVDSNGNGGPFKQALAYSKTIGQVIDAGNSGYKSAEEGINFIKNKLPSLAPKIDVAGFDKIIPGLGAAIGVFDFLSGLFGGSTSSAISYDVNLKATGNLTTTDPYKSVAFENPGSANLTLVPATLLNYNNVMGVLNLMESPEIIYTGQTFFTQPNEFFFKLNKPVQVLINPNAGFDQNLSDIKCALVFEFPLLGGSVDLNPYTTIQDVILVDNLLNINPYLTIFLNNTMIFEGIVGDKKIYRTRYLPIGCFENMVVRAKAGKNVELNTMPTYLKVVATLKDNSSQTNHQNVFVSKYKISKLFTSTTSNSLWSSNFVNIQDDVTLNSLVTNNVKAWNSIMVNTGSSFVNSGITLTAGNTVSISVGGAVTTGVILRTGSPNGCNTTPSYGDPSIICSSSTNTYYTKSHAFAREQEDEPDSVKSRTESSFSFFPNPANNKVTFNYLLEEASQVGIALYDTNGKTIAAPVNSYHEAGEYEFIYDAATTPSGMYIVKFESSKLSKTEKLVVIK